MKLKEGNPTAEKHQQLLEAINALLEEAHRCPTPGCKYDNVSMGEHCGVCQQVLRNSVFFKKEELVVEMLNLFFEYAEQPKVSESILEDPSRVVALVEAAQKRDPGALWILCIPKWMIDSFDLEKVLDESLEEAKS
ncbi:hypothetical protein NW762_012561 [Fusarium torreyae]|uniref:Uncharacterized protein n=1 Tax=Fusarium torreyae TaxID=1237075 RepID=A0A9W8RQ69_9HYPO|nr:hypothetical protein NW762_012561 [Fusarium torreyae]